MSVAPYGLVADVHLHAWSKFATVDQDGVNSRLKLLLGELLRCARTVRAWGGDHMVIAGDLFHVRGNVRPTVLNPTIETIRAIGDLGVKVIIVAGNHDLELREASRVGSAVEALKLADNVKVVSEVTESFDTGGRWVTLVPWCDDLTKLMATLKALPPMFGRDLIIHAPIDGVIAGLSGGLSWEDLASLSVERVFAGHYHNHKAFFDRVYSIGALAHHTWSDVGSRAGFLIVHEDRVERFDTELPKFVSIDAQVDEAELAIAAQGNYVRIKTDATGAGSAANINALRDGLTALGALGVEIIAVPTPTLERDSSISESVSKGATVEASVSQFIDLKGYANAEKVRAAAFDILNRV